jgi:hypothetical protein
MTVDEAVIHFKSGYEMCKQLGILPVNYSKWKEKKFIPLKQQHRINEITKAQMPIDIDKKAMEERIGNRIYT